ncbi:MAG TPA: RNA 2',3'-cyclic phosphodiesterase [Coriobacteriia bacterium]|nr:RNA 2',3'-cyclic phosphodiesterase [Coriobacteriia bacterium]
MRCFVGIELDEGTLGDLTAVATALRSADPRWAAERWVPSCNLHFTLRFLGDLPDARIDALAAHLRCTFATWVPFDAACAHAAEAVPNSRRARMLWTRYHDPCGAFTALAEAVGDAAETLGIAREPKNARFVPHVTLVRTRDPRPFQTSALTAVPSVRPVSVRKVTVFSSVLTRSGPVYERLAALALAAV